jgi:uncharacterized small protein (TIGR04563 family)
MRYKAGRRKVLYLSDRMLAEMDREARRQERSLSQMVCFAWRMAKAEIEQFPVVPRADREEE